MIAELKHILLAEDNANDVELTLEALRENHLVNEVVVTRDGAEALDYLYQRNRYAGRAGGRPALVLLDLKMPEKDGFFVLETLKARKMDVRVIVLTAYADVKSAIDSAKLGASDFISKPYDFDELLITIRKVLQKEKEHED